MNRDRLDARIQEILNEKGLKSKSRMAFEHDRRANKRNEVVVDADPEEGGEEEDEDQDQNVNGENEGPEGDDDDDDDDDDGGEFRVSDSSDSGIPPPKRARTSVQYAQRRCV